MQSEKPHLCLISQPNRYQKYLKYEILKQKCFNVYENIWKLEKTYHNINQFKNQSIKNRKNTTFTYPLFNSPQKFFGVFSSNLFNYLKNIKKYTIIENPVDRVYQLHWYMIFANKTYGEFANHKLDLDTLIDLYIANTDNVIVTNKYNGVMYKSSSDGANQFKNLNEFEFVGTVEKMKKSLDIINNAFDTNIKYHDKMKRVPLDYEKYRRSELETALSKQLEEYFKINDNL